MELRACTIRYEAFKKKEMDKTEIELENEIKQLEINLNLGANKDSILEKIDSFKEELESIRREKLKRNKKKRVLYYKNYNMVKNPPNIFFNLNEEKEDRKADYSTS